MDISALSTFSIFELFIIQKYKPLKKKSGPVLKQRALCSSPNPPAYCLKGWDKSVPSALPCRHWQTGNYNNIGAI